MKKIIQYVITAFVVIGSPLFMGGIAHAATEVLAITPTDVHPVVDAGSVTAGSFQVVNQGQDGYQVHIYAAPYSVKGENYTPDFMPIPGAPSVASWLQFSTTQDAVKPSQSINVHYTLSVPKNTPPGGYYAVAFVETQLPKSTQGVVVNERVGEVFYIQVSGPVKQAGSLLSWSTPFFQKSSVVAALRLEDSGGVHYVSNIHVVVSDLFGSPKYTLSTQKVVLPQTIRNVPITWNHVPSLGLFKVSGSATVLGHTYVLSTKYVLVMSQTVRKVSMILGVTIVALLLAPFVVGKKRSKKHRRMDI